jgi:hypothetical protein
MGKAALPAAFFISRPRDHPDDEGVAGAICARDEFVGLVRQGDIARTADHRGNAVGAEDAGFRAAGTI